MPILIIALLPGNLVSNIRMKAIIIYAGGRHVGINIELEVIKEVSQGYLTSLWNNDTFTKSDDLGYQNLADRISQYFVYFVLALGILATISWMFIDTTKAINVFTAVLIVACPCALALSIPFHLWKCDSNIW